MKDWIYIAGLYNIAITRCPLNHSYFGVVDSKVDDNIFLWKWIAEEFLVLANYRGLTQVTSLRKLSPKAIEAQFIHKYFVRIDLDFIRPQNNPLIMHACINSMKMELCRLSKCHTLVILLTLLPNSTTLLNSGVTHIPVKAVALLSLQWPFGK